MTTNRTRHRTRPGRQQQPPPVDHDQVQVDDDAAELAALWRVFPDALARDSSGTLDRDGGRHASGAANGSASPGNLAVMEAIARIETGLYERAAETIRLLNLEPGRRSPVAIITALPDWHRSLAGRDQPLAKHLRSDLAGWLREARGAIGIRRHDRKLGPQCPDHRDEQPTPLLEVGDHARLAASLIAGPPAVSFRLAGPRCRTCAHPSCHAIAARRLVDGRGRPLDWVATPDGPVWSSATGAPALQWEKSSIIRCPRCKTEWKSTTDRRVLARRLAALGDDRVDVTAAIA